MLSYFNRSVHSAGPSRGSWVKQGGEEGQRGCKPDRSGHASEILRQESTERCGGRVWFKEGSGRIGMESLEVQAVPLELCGGSLRGRVSNKTAGRMGGEIGHRGPKTLHARLEKNSSKTLHFTLNGDWGSRRVQAGPECQAPTVLCAKESTCFCREGPFKRTAVAQCPCPGDALL